MRFLLRTCGDDPGEVPGFPFSLNDQDSFRSFDRIADQVPFRSRLFERDDPDQR